MKHFVFLLLGSFKRFILNGQNVRTKLHRNRDWLERWYFFHVLQLNLNECCDNQFGVYWKRINYHEPPWIPIIFANMGIYRMAFNVQNYRLWYWYAVVQSEAWYASNKSKREGPKTGFFFLMIYQNIFKENPIFWLFVIINIAFM